MLTPLKKIDYIQLKYSIICVTNQEIEKPASGLR